MTMRRFPIILAVAALLVGCSDAPPPWQGAPQQGVTASFPPGAVTGVIRIDAQEAQPLRAAELVAPDGTATPARTLDVDPNPERISGQNALGDPWRSSGLASNGINPLPSGVIDPTARSRDQLLLMVSTADIALPDPVAYRRDWSSYKIRLSFGTGDRLDVREIPAPRPPAEQAGG